MLHETMMITMHILHNNVDELYNKIMIKIFAFSCVNFSLTVDQDATLKNI